MPYSRSEGSISGFCLNSNYNISLFMLLFYIRMGFGNLGKTIASVNYRFNFSGLGQLLQVRGKRAEEVVDGQAQAPRRVRLEEVEGPVEEGEVVVRRDHVDRVRPDGQAVRDLDHRHRSGALEELGEHPPVRRVQVLDDHEGHAALGRDAGEELLEGLEPAGRRAYPDDRELIPGHRGGGGSSLPPGPSVSLWKADTGTVEGAG